MHPDIRVIIGHGVQHRLAPFISSPGGREQRADGERQPDTHEWYTEERASRGHTFGAMTVTPRDPHESQSGEDDGDCENADEDKNACTHQGHILILVLPGSVQVMAAIGCHDRRGYHGKLEGKKNPERDSSVEGSIPGVDLLLASSLFSGQGMGREMERLTL